MSDFSMWPGFAGQHARVKRADNRSPSGLSVLKAEAEGWCVLKKKRAGFQEGGDGAPTR
jgi:hypothetical protein